MIALDTWEILLGSGQVCGRVTTLIPGGESKIGS